MSGFSFPPPPPPPPRATSSSQQEAPPQFNNRGGRGGRGNRGGFRGRGGPQQRGGRNFQLQNASNHNDSGYGQNNANFQQNYGNPVPSPQQWQMPPGAHMNPAFNAFQPQPYTQAPPPQYGQQHGYSAGQNNSPLPGSHGNASFSPGSKRTRDQAFGHSHKHPMKKPPSAPKTQVAPAVPSFGTPILPPKAVSASVPAYNFDRKQKPSGSLGLIPQDYVSGESSGDDEEEDVDEEAAFGALQDGPLSFEFNGELATLKSATDIAEWIQERKKLWPSKRRVEEKQQEVQSRMDERKRIERETRQAIAIASGGGYQPVERKDNQERSGPHRKSALQDDKQSEAGSILEEAQRQLELQTQELEELQQLSNSKGQAQEEASDEQPSNSGQHQASTVMTETTDANKGPEDPVVTAPEIIPPPTQTVTPPPKKHPQNSTSPYEYHLHPHHNQNLTPNKTSQNNASVSPTKVDASSATSAGTDTMHQARLKARGRLCIRG